MVARTSGGIGGGNSRFKALEGYYVGVGWRLKGLLRGNI